MPRGHEHSRADLLGRGGERLAGLLLRLRRAGEEHGDQGGRKDQSQDGAGQPGHGITP